MRAVRVRVAIAIIFFYRLILFWIPMVCALTKYHKKNAMNFILKSDDKNNNIGILGVMAYAYYTHTADSVWFGEKWMEKYWEREKHTQTHSSMYNMMQSQSQVFFLFLISVYIYLQHNRFLNESAHVYAVG